MNSAASCSMRSAVSPTFLPTRVVVSSTLRLKSSITPQILIREIPHTQPRHYFAPPTPGQSKLPILSNFILSRRVTHLFVFSAKRVGGPTTRTYNRITTEMKSPTLRRALLTWYDANRRDLPWRKTRDPYRVWISEIMLQQTRVAAVIPRYVEFLRRFPSVQKLAAARESSVLAQWSGLGYYRRARNLHNAAKIIKREKVVPQTAETWRALPGIGRYTAAAIASIAFDEPVAVVDGNVERVLRRVLGSAMTKNESWEAAQSFLDPARPGDFNQAMMELGATICLPGQPQCQPCPISKFCCTRGASQSTTVILDNI